MKLFRKECGRPPSIKPSREELSIIKLPPKEQVEDRINEIIKDENVRNILKDLINAIYRLRPDSEFILWIKTNAIRYRLYDKPDKMADFMAVMTLAFVDWCAKQVYGGGVTKIASGKINLEELKEPECSVISLIFEEIRGLYMTVNIPRRKVVSIAIKWKKETNKLIELWDKIERDWCRY